MLLSQELQAVTATTLDDAAKADQIGAMPRMVNCIKLGKELEGLDRAPVKGELGQRVFDNVSKEAWKLWIAHSTMIVNEYRLELGTPEAAKIWLAELDKFFFGEGSQAPEGYVPPTADGHGHGHSH
jgi:Fe-S cluster biosynthesis and repair protein YggX